MFNYPMAKKRYFYDDKWNLTSEDQAKYYREYSKLNTLNMTYTIKAFYTNNHQLQWMGDVRNNDPSATNCDTALCEGKTTWYSEDGPLSSERNYLEGRQHGKFIIYLKNGEIIIMNYDRGHYIKDE